MEFGKLFGGMGILVSAIVFAGFLTEVAIAQPDVVVTEDGDVIELQPIPEEFEDAFFSHDEDFYENHRFPRNIAWYIGFFFPENEISSDAEAVNELYRELLEVQNTSDITIRVVDYPSPFTGSLATTPLYVEEPIPPAPAPVYRAPREEPITPSEPRETTPVPALW